MFIWLEDSGVHLFSLINGERVLLDHNKDKETANNPVFDQDSVRLSNAAPS